MENVLGSDPDNLEEYAMGYGNDDGQEQACRNQSGEYIDETTDYEAENDRTRTLDCNTSWGLYADVDDSNQWFDITNHLGVAKSPSQLSIQDMLNKEFASLEMAVLFYMIYGRTMDFSVCKEYMRKGKNGQVKNREWLCARGGHRNK